PARSDGELHNAVRFRAGRHDLTHTASADQREDLVGSEMWPGFRSIAAYQSYYIASLGSLRRGDVIETRREAQPEGPLPPGLWPTGPPPWFDPTGWAFPTALLIRSKCLLPRLSGFCLGLIIIKLMAYSLLQHYGCEWFLDELPAI